MNKTKYVPAIGEQFNSVWTRGLNYKEFDMKFFTDRSHFNHNIGLQSCYYGIEGVGKQCKEDQTYRDLVQYPKDKTLIGDSGGFQIASFKMRGQECKLKPIDSLRWQEENCDIMMNLDVPPTLGEAPTLKSFNESLNTSVKNFQLFEKERKNHNNKLLNVLHGESLPLISKWYNEVKDFNFEGWAIGMKPPYDPMLQAFGFMYLWEKGEFDKSNNKWIHFFGTSGKHVVPAIVYMANKLKIPVSYDSSSYNIGSIYRTYYLPFDMGPNLSFGDKYQTVNPNVTELPCKCPVCNSIDNINILNGKDIFAGTLISLHNMYQYIQYNDLLNSLVKQHDKFLDYLTKVNINQKTFKAIEFIDFAIDNGINKAIDKYKKDLVSQEIKKSVATNIFNF